MPSRTITKYHFHMGQSAGKSVRPTLPTATMRTRTGADAGLWLYPGTIVQDAIRGRKEKVRNWLLDFNLLMSYWGGPDGSGGGGRTYHHTAPINALYGLHEALVALFEEGQQAAE